MYAVRVEGLTKYYGDVAALRGVSFSVRRGERVGYLGPNGAGKTTTIKVLLGLVRPTDGYAEVLGNDVVRRPESIRGRVGYVQQGISFELGLTVEQNLNLYGYLWGLDAVERRRRVRELMEVFGLDRYARAYPNQLSLGLRRLLQVARELLHEPEVLFLDEPTTGLDPVARVRVLDYVFRWSRDRGVTVFLTTHIPQDVERLCSRVILLCGGRVRADLSVGDFKRVFGGLSRVEVVFSAPVSGGFRVALEGALAGAAELIRFCGNAVSMYVRGDSVARVVEASVLTASRFGVRVASLRIEEPTLEDALIKAYLGG